VKNGLPSDTVNSRSLKMRVLKTEDCFYVGGGNASDTNTGSFGDVGNMGASVGDSGSTGQVAASGPSLAQAYTTCLAIALSAPTPPGFVKACVNTIMGGGSAPSPGGPGSPGFDNSTSGGYISLAGDRG
jgi:hypothetical protein